MPYKIDVQKNGCQQFILYKRKSTDTFSMTLQIMNQGPTRRTRANKIPVWKDRLKIQVAQLPNVFNYSEDMKSLIPPASLPFIVIMRRHLTQAMSLVASLPSTPLIVGRGLGSEVGSATDTSSHSGRHCPNERLLP